MAHGPRLCHDSSRPDSTTPMAASTSPPLPNTHKTSVPKLALDTEGLEAKPEPTAVRA